VTPVGAVLDLTHDPHPVLLERVVALDDGLQLEALARVADLLFAQRMEAPIHVFVDHLRGHLLDPHEVLIVERPQPFDAGLQFFDGDVEFRGIHEGLRR